MKKAEQPERREGFDSAGGGQEDDKLNRWPFAKEIYGIATTCPKEWSVRIGVYGDWGSGKSTVLNFVKVLAKKGKHLIVCFNPWQYQSTEELWPAFVQELYTQIQSHVGSLPGKKGVALKQFLSGCTTILKELATLDPRAEKASNLGLPLLKKYTQFGSKDVQNIPTFLGDSKVLILIDDLDRADPSIVPQILFALKEILDMPGFSFICAFDPEVVGVVLGEYHPGFGNGLKFLEKIIDYPRWLPPPSRENILRLARSDIEKFCEFVPTGALDEVKDLLPENPRALRQYVRHLTLLRPQIIRHHDYELNWPAILAADLLKVEYPKFSFDFFTQADFWKEAAFAGWGGKKSEDKQEIFIAEKVKEVANKAGVKDETITQRLIRITSRICSFSKALTGEDLRYQTLLAEEPHAVTWKEFDQFLAEWRKRPDQFDIPEWMRNQALSQDQSVERVFGELFESITHRRLQSFDKAAEGISKQAMKGPLTDAKDLLILLQKLTFDVGQPESVHTLITAEQFAQATNMVRHYIHFKNTPEYRECREAESAYLLRFVEAWKSGAQRILKDFNPWSQDFLEPGVKAKEELCNAIVKIVLPRFTQSLLDRFRQLDFVRSIIPEGAASEEKQVLFDPNSHFWKKRRSDVLSLFKEAKTNSVIHENLYQFISMLGFHWKERLDKNVEALLQDKEIVSAIWDGAVASRLNPRAFGSLKDFPDRLKADFNIELSRPDWWNLPNEARENIEANERV
ncbi:MAG: hypothetical protein HY360_20100 [Verrucomicrobia bacterium]|nr:hypothetical protein [Verrucomicrobiota bacterium]